VFERPMMQDAEAEGSTTARRRDPRSIRGKPIHFIILILAALVGLFDRALAGWGIPILVATVSLLIPLFYWRDCWRRASFWAGMTLAAAPQVPFAIFVRPLIQHDRAFYFLLFMFADLVFAPAAVILIAQVDPSSPLNTRDHSSRQEQPK
jgi:hypothetical protein